jgi:diguanylate cyclase (GGDEF)-like protein
MDERIVVSVPGFRPPAFLCSSMRLELQIAILFLLSLAALIFDYAVPRTHEVDYRSDDWHAMANFGGDVLGGANAAITDRGFEMRIKMEDRGQNAYCAATFERGEDAPVIDLGWCSTIDLTARIEGKGLENFRLLVMNRIPEIFTTEDVVSRQYNEVAVMLTEERQKLSFSVERFHVPSWWVEKYGSKFEHSISSFGLVDGIQVAIGSSVTDSDLNLIVEKVEFRGHWIPPLILYRSLLASWLVLGAGVFLQKLLDINTALKQSNEREHRLRQINDSLELKATELSRLAHHDSLTGLMNRQGIFQYADLAREAVSRGDKVGLCILDIDDFKVINDTNGHKHGDEVLVAMGEMFSESTNGMDLFARWGGEEFIAICFGKDEGETWMFADKIGRMIESEIGVTCSLGVCQLDEGEEFIDGVDRADKALYAAKARGKNRAISWRDIAKSQVKTAV